MRCAPVKLGWRGLLACESGSVVMNEGVRVAPRVRSTRSRITKQKGRVGVIGWFLCALSI